MNVNPLPLASERVCLNAIRKAEPYDVLPLEYIPRVEERYFPSQVNFGIDFNEQEIRIFAEKHHIRPYQDFSSMAFEVLKYCAAQCALLTKRSLWITKVGGKEVHCLTFIDNYELSQCRPEDLEEAIWRLEDLWHEAGFESKQFLWHTSGTQANRKKIMENIDPSPVIETATLPPHNMNRRSLASEYMRPSILEAGPWDALPLKYIPRVKDYYFPAQLNLGIDFNDQEIRTFAEKHNIRLYRDFTSMAFEVSKRCAEQCSILNEHPLGITMLARKGLHCLSFIDNYELNQCRPEDLEPAIWRLEDLWHEAGFEEKQIMWHTSGTQANRKNIISSIDPTVVM